jgi:hypothetical protein
MTITEFLLARIAEDEADVRSHFCERGFEVRMLAECAAKRAIVELAVAVQNTIEGEWGGGKDVTIDNAEEWDRDYLGWEMLQTLAAVYKDHPDYQPEWAL